ncbi:hypothetical protein [Ottowia thiooxydans]|uniref:Uncharacterized protein n=1 Tax=Ottowia thiooxydans TaxID=219182 RepID=A0ABV2QEV4_9BURK
MVNSTAQNIGRYLVTPITRRTESGLYQASVSIRRGMHDRIFRFIPQFCSDSGAQLYALDQARSMVLNRQIG